MESEKPKETKCAKSIILKTVLENAVETIPTAVKYPAFARLFPTLKNADYVQKLHRKHQESIASNMKTELALLLAEENISEKLDQFEELLKVATVAKEPWRPDRNPEKSIVAHEVKALMEEQEELKNILAEEEAENTRLKLMVQENKLQILKNEKLIDICSKQDMDNVMALDKIENIFKTIKPTKEN